MSIEFRMNESYFIIHVPDSVYTYGNRNHGKYKKMGSLWVKFVSLKKILMFIFDRETHRV